MEHANPTAPQDLPPRYRWPWVVLAAVVLAVVLAVLWMSREVNRMRRIRELNAPAASTNAQAFHATKG